MTTSGYRFRRDGGGRRWIGRYGVEDGGGWGFAAGGEGVLAPTEYEWGNEGRWGPKGGQCFGLGRACLKFGESYKLCPHLKFWTYCGLGVGLCAYVSPARKLSLGLSRTHWPPQTHLSLSSW